MGTKAKEGTNFLFPIEFLDEYFSTISSIEFLFKQVEGGETLKTALWSRDGESHDAVLLPDTQMILVHFTAEESYLFRPDEWFFCDTRIHYDWTDYNPPTPILRMRMCGSFFRKDEEET